MEAIRSRDVGVITREGGIGYCLLVPPPPTDKLTFYHFTELIEIKMMFH